MGQPGPVTGFVTTWTVDLFNDGSGPAIYVGGGFSSYGGVPASSLARFDGRAWSAVDDGLHGPTGASADHAAVISTRRGPAIFYVGEFTSAGGGLVDNSVLLVGCPNCYANCDQSTVAPVLNVSDFVCFLNKFAARAPEANCNNDASIDVADFVCFLNRYAAGCP